MKVFFHFALVLIWILTNKTLCSAAEKKSVGEKLFSNAPADSKQLKYHFNNRGDTVLIEFPDENMKKQFEYYSNKKIRSEIILYNQKKTKESIFSSAGKILKEINFNSDIETNYFYHPNGIIKRIELISLSNKQLHGTTTDYFIDGTLKKAEDYSAGKINGKKIEYFRNGLVKFSGEFVDDNPVAELTMYYPGSEKKIMSKIYYENNKVMSSANFSINGELKYFIVNGAGEFYEYGIDNNDSQIYLKSRTNYSGGLKNGIRRNCGNIHLCRWSETGYCVRVLSIRKNKNNITIPE